jgi:hypothetical protein
VEVLAEVLALVLLVRVTMVGLLNLLMNMLQVVVAQDQQAEMAYLIKEVQEDLV